MRSSSPGLTWCAGLTGRPAHSMRPASSASLAAVRRFAKRDTLRNLSSLMIFGALPERIEIVQAPACKRGRAAAGEALHRRETSAEPHVRAAQRGFGVNAETAREIDDGEEHVAEFIAHAVARAAVHGVPQLVDFLLQFFNHAVRLGPVESDRRGLFLEPLRSEERRQALWDAVQERLAVLDRCFLRLEQLPRLHLFLRRRDACVAEHMRVAADHLVRERVYHVGDRELTFFSGYL